MSKKLLILNGPNMNLLGEREAGVYGNKTLEDINMQIESRANKNGFACEFYQSNSEGHLIDKIHKTRKTVDGIIINAGAYSHYSYAIRDAIAAIKIPVVEVHYSNIFAREEFRHNSVITPVCCGSILGFGKNSYLLAVDALIDIITEI